MKGALPRRQGVKEYLALHRHLANRTPLDIRKGSKRLSMATPAARTGASQTSS
jgi:hypothetical protein